MRMNEREIVESAAARIRAHRSAEVELRLRSRNAPSLANARIEVRLTRHEFLFGCNAFLVGTLAEETLRRGYEERFAGLLNYATLPFYWGGYEPEPGRTSEERLEKMAAWCAANGVTAKGHPLVWHEVFPSWAGSLPDTEALARQEARVRKIVSHFRGRIDIWDVVNEATVSHRFDNAVGRWIARDGAAACVARALQWAHEANPTALLLYNDFNISEDFERLVGSLLDRKAPLGAIGIQSHMHCGAWNAERVWQVCESYAKFGLPLHFTETTLLSGRLKDPADKDWHAQREGWVSTPEGEARQLTEGEMFYSVLFSHPAVEAITWWDFSDLHSWQAAPAGLVRRDMTPKPLYDRLHALVHGQWATRAQTQTDRDGRALVRCFFGKHELEATLPSGQTLRGSFSVARRGSRSVEVELS